MPNEPHRFSDNRTDDQRREERLEIQKQIDHLARFPNDQERQRKVLERLAEGRRARGLPPFVELSAATLPAVPALAVREFLVRRADLHRSDVQELINGFQLAPTPLNTLGGELVRLTLPETATAPDEQFRAAVTAAITKTIPVTPNWLVPQGDGWTKGEGGPEPTLGVPEWRPPSTTRIQVAVIDSGLGPRTDKWLQNLTNPAIDPLYTNPVTRTLGLAGGHGTFVAGIVQQVEPSTDIRMYRALDIDGNGLDETVGTLIEQAARDGAQVINLSIGTQTVNDIPPLGMATGIQRAIAFNGDILIVCCAGNFGDTRKVWPAAFSLTFPRNVVAVSGLNAQLQKPNPEWPTHGDFVQFSTRAEGIVSTYVEGTEDIVVEDPPDTFELNDFATWTGTSFAAPQITGRVASTCLTHGEAPAVAVQRLKVGTTIDGYGFCVDILPGT